AGMADARAPGTGADARRVGRSRPARARGRDRVQRHPEKPAIPGRARPAPCARQALPRGQAGRGRRHRRSRAHHPRAGDVLRTLDDWLEYIGRQHSQTIAMGLERVVSVLDRMKLKIAHPVITVGGTNGKGSTCAMLESILRSAGYRTGLYSSPHLVRYNERVLVAGAESDDGPLCEAFAAVEAARGDVPLTYFEFGTLAALWIFQEMKIEAAVLEVGLGGRLDAVNAVDALGLDRESIGREKAGIFRAGRPAVIAEPEPPRSVLEAPGEKLFIGRDFSYAGDGTQWSYAGPKGKRAGLAYPALRGVIQLRNAAAALCALDALE